MHPVLIDLSQFKLFGLSMDSVLARVVGFVLVAVVGHFLAAQVMKRRERSDSRWMDPVAGLCLLGLGFVVMGLVWIVGKVHSYGLMMALGFITAMIVGRRKTRRCGENPEVIGNLGILALIGGVVGARLAYVIEHWDQFSAVYVNGARRGGLDRVIDVFKLTSGGLVFDGGLILAIIAVLVFLKVKKLPVRRFLDILAICAMVGLAFGRVGCLLNGCCYGGRCADDFAMGIRFPYAGAPLVYPHEGPNPYPPGANVSLVYHDQFDRVPELVVPPELAAASSGGRFLKPPGELTDPHACRIAQSTWSLPVHPAQVYGIINALVLAALLAAIMRLRSREGQVFAWLLVLYPITRFMLEYIRDDNPDMALTPAQGKCLILTAVGVALLWLLRRLPASCGPGAAEREPATATPTIRGPARKRERRKKLS